MKELLEVTLNPSGAFEEYIKIPTETHGYLVTECRVNVTENINNLIIYSKTNTKNFNKLTAININNYLLTDNLKNGGYYALDVTGIKELKVEGSSNKPIKLSFLYEVK